MTQPQSASKEQLLQALRSSEQQLADTIGAIDPAALDAGCYENGWNARQVLAHIASIEWTYPKVLDLAATGASDTAAAQPSASRPPASGGIGSYNDRQIEKRAEATVAELLDEFRENRAKTIAAIESADETLLGRTVRSAGGIEGPAATVLQTLAVGHLMLHLNDIKAAVKQA